MMAPDPRTPDAMNPPHALDDPIWSALTTRQRDFSIGTDRARRFHPDVGPFAALAERSPDAWSDLRALVADTGPVAFLATEPLPPLTDFATESLGTILQMVATARDFEPATPDLQALGADDAAEMLALATLTKPGPFGPRTRELGRFLGIRVDDALAAMAGERMRFGDHVEISAVCVHPDHLGRGHAARLMHAVAHRIVADGHTPFLHVFERNTRAVAIYEKLGYRTRRRFALHRLLVPTT